MPRATIDRPRTALLGTLAILLAALAGLAALSDPPLLAADAVAGRERRAALALRDPEIPFFTWGTKLYTVSNLAPSYAEVRYFTEFERGEHREAVLAAAVDLLTRYDEVDVFLAVHGSWYVAWFASLPRDLTRRLRLVYSTGCGDFGQADQWLSLGADAFVGHPGELSASPVFYVYFLRRWVRGRPLAEAVRAANEKAGNRLRLVDEEIARQTTAKLAGATGLTLGAPR